jgi:hypothetical protein
MSQFASASSFLWWHPSDAFNHRLKLALRQPRSVPPKIVNLLPKIRAKRSSLKETTKRTYEVRENKGFLILKLGTNLRKNERPEFIQNT